MNCRAFETQVAEYIAGRLDTPQAARLAAHVAHCPHCASREAEERALRQRFQAMPLPMPSPDLWPQIAGQIAPRPVRSPRFQLPRQWAYGGAFAAAVVCGLLFLPHGLTPSTSPEMPSAFVHGSTPGRKIETPKPNADVVKSNVDEAKVARMVSDMRRTTFDESDSLADGQSDQDARVVLLGGR